MSSVYSATPFVFPLFGYHSVLLLKYHIIVVKSMFLFFLKTPPKTPPYQNWIRKLNKCVLNLSILFKLNLAFSLRCHHFVAQFYKRYHTQLQMHTFQLFLNSYKFATSNLLKERVKFVQLMVRNCSKLFMTTCVRKLQNNCFYAQ